MFGPTAGGGQPGTGSTWGGSGGGSTPMTQSGGLGATTSTPAYGTPAGGGLMFGPTAGGGQPGTGSTWANTPSSSWQAAPDAPPGLLPGQGMPSNYAMPTSQSNFAAAIADQDPYNPMQQVYGSSLNSAGGPRGIFNADGTPMSGSSYNSLAATGYQLAQNAGTPTLQNITGADQLQSQAGGPYGGFIIEPGGPTGGGQLLAGASQGNKPGSLIYTAGGSLPQQSAAGSLTTSQFDQEVASAPALQYLIAMNPALANNYGAPAGFDVNQQSLLDTQAQGQLQGQLQKDNLVQNLNYNNGNYTYGTNVSIPGMQQSYSMTPMTSQQAQSGMTGAFNPQLGMYVDQTPITGQAMAPQAQQQANFSGPGTFETLGSTIVDPALLYRAQLRAQGQNA